MIGVAGSPPWANVGHRSLTRWAISRACRTLSSAKHGRLNKRVILLLLLLQERGGRDRGPSDGLLHFRMLVPAKKAGCVIGKVLHRDLDS